MFNLSKKTKEKKERLGKNLKKARRIPVLAIRRTHRRISMNLFARNWRKDKLKIK